MSPHGSRAKHLRASGKDGEENRVGKHLRRVLQPECERENSRGFGSVQTRRRATGMIAL